MPSVRKKTLFLEIEGVLHHRSATVAQFLNRMPTLEAAIGASEVDIIICSKWRLENSFDKLTASFPAALRARIERPKYTFLEQVRRQQPDPPEDNATHRRFSP